MNAIKPYLFWVICGALLLIEVVVCVTIEPTTDKGKNVADAKVFLDKEFKKVKKLRMKSQNTLPAFFDPNDLEGFSRIQEDYLISNRWESGLRGLKKLCETQQTSIHDELLRVSAPLNTIVSENHALRPWYQAYEDASSAVLRKLYDGGLLDHEFSQKGDLSEVLRTDTMVREKFGLFTMKGVYPPKEDHEQLRMRLRIIEALAEELLQVEREASSNTAISRQGVIKDEDRSVARAYLRRIEWSTKRSRGAKSGSEFKVKGGFFLGMNLSLYGEPTALLAASARLESLPAPVFVVKGSTLDCIDSNSNGRASGKTANRPMNLHMQVAVPYFTKEELNKTLEVLAAAAEEEEDY